jgi:hypothetical protein
MPGQSARTQERSNVGKPDELKTLENEEPAPMLTGRGEE